MKFTKINEKYIIKLEKGEKIIETLTQFCTNNNIESGYFFGIGAVSKAEIAHFSLDTKEYSYKTFNEPLEIVSLLGNISILKNKIMIHSHITLSNPQMKAYGGHLKEATISATCEIVLKKINTEIKRKLDKITNLNLLDL